MRITTLISRYLDLVPLFVLMAVKKEKVKVLIENGSLTTIEDIIDLLGSSAIAKAMKANKDTIKSRGQRPEMLRYIEIKGIADYLEVPIPTVWAMIENQLVKKKKR